MKLKTKRTLIWLAILIGSLGLAGVVLAQVSTNFDLSWHLLSGGGGFRSSSTYWVDDSLGQWADRTSTSARYNIEPGFWYGVPAAPPCTVSLSEARIEGPTSGFTDTLYAFTTVITPSNATEPVIYTWTPSPSSEQGRPSASYEWATPGVYTLAMAAWNCGGAFTDTHTIDISGETPAEGDSYEVDDTCDAASTILTDGLVQTHTFHDAEDEDWIEFTVEANKTYVIETSNVGADHDAILFLYDACGAPDLGSEDNAFGQTVHVEWSSTSAGTYYLMLQQYDPAIYGESTRYDITVELDTTPPSAPKDLRSAPADEALIFQWKRSPELDVVEYEICYSTESTESGGCQGYWNVEGGNTTYYEGTGLINGTDYYARVRAFDFSHNPSLWTSEIHNAPAIPQDATNPSVTVNQPTTAAVYTTTLGAATIGGNAQDTGNNLSRVKVRNVTKGVEGWDYSLAGNSDTFYVENIGLNPGNNTIQVTAYDDVGNEGSTTLTFQRLGQTDDGVVIIVAGHNASNSLQSNIYNAANHAYRVFQGAGFSDDAIYYLSPTAQAPYGDGNNKVDATATSANLQYAIETWAVASGRVGPGQPLHLYMMDHGETEYFCTDGCGSSGRTTSNDLDSWLDTLESSTGADTINVIIEACRSGSFIDRVEGEAASISEDGRVVIASTGRNNNAYASTEGAYFSDAFFSCVVGSGSLKTCYDQAKAAVALTGNDQTPWLDDNGDGLSSPIDGSIAQNRYIASAFGSFQPEIQSASVDVVDGSGTLTASVEQGAEEIDMVWAAVYSPSFQEPVSTTLNLGVPVVLLEADPDVEGSYTATYPGGFTEEGPYRVIFYAQDLAGTHAPPKLVTPGETRIYLPVVLKD